MQSYSKTLDIRYIIYYYYIIPTTGYKFSVFSSRARFYYIGNNVMCHTYIYIVRILWPAAAASAAVQYAHDISYYYGA